MKGKELKTIHVSEEVWRRLVELKLELRLRSLDDVVRYLLERATLKSAEEIRQRVRLWEEFARRAFACYERGEEAAPYPSDLLGQLGHAWVGGKAMLDDYFYDGFCARHIIKELEWVLGEGGG
jgi:predicted CopG family antitoxin